MASSFEEKLRDWAKPPSKTEQQKCENAESSIRNAISASDRLKNRSIKIFAQGSYRNNTNVRQDSDVDIGVLCQDVFFYDLPAGKSPDDFGIVAASYAFQEFKNDVENALRAYFGRNAVKRGNKAFDVHETTYHVEADVAPFFEHRRYLENGKYVIPAGVELRPDRGGRVKNWPEQHYSNGVDKNTRTGRRFKAMVRALKALGYEIEEAGGNTIPSFLIECLVWNVPDTLFGNENHTDDLRGILENLYNRLGTSDSDEWVEVSELKYLFASSQPWTKDQARQFVVDVWNHVGFK